MLTCDGSNGVPLKGDPSASHALRRMSCAFYTHTHTHTHVEIKEKGEIGDSESLG